MSDMRFIVNERGKEQLVIDDAVLRFHNFAGEQTEFNAKGNRNIDVVLPDKDMAVEMGERGWNVKIRKPRNEDEEPYYTLNIKINLDSKWPPDFYQYDKSRRIDITLAAFKNDVEREARQRGERLTDEEITSRAREAFGRAVSNFDDINLTEIGLLINGSAWESNFGHGIKAYLDEMHFRLKPSPFGNRYSYEENAAPEFETEDVPF